MLQEADNKTHTYTHAYTHTHAHAHTYIHMYTHTHIHTLLIHTYIHTHIHGDWLELERSKLGRWIAHVLSYIQDTQRDIYRYIHFIHTHTYMHLIHTHIHTYREIGLT